MNDTMNDEFYDTRVCADCGREFSVFKGDDAIYCADCRRFHNE